MLGRRMANGLAGTVSANCIGAITDEELSNRA